jgi:hypothetical protein
MAGVRGAEARYHHPQQQLLRRLPQHTRRGYGHTHQQRAHATIAAQPWCSICGATTDLTADHKRRSVSEPGACTDGELEHGEYVRPVAHQTRALAAQGQRECR